MNSTAERLDPLSLKSTILAPEPPAFEFPNDEEQAIFEDICDFIAERAAILEYDAGFAPDAAEAEAERLAMDRYPPSPTARAAILAHANRMAAYYGLPGWIAVDRLSDAQIHRLHVNHGHWLALRDYFKRLAT